MNRLGYLIVGLIVAAFAFLVFWAGMAVGSNFERKRHFPAPADTIRAERIDTMLIVSPPDTVTVTEVRIVKVAVHDTVTVKDSTVTVKDSVEVELPFEHHLTSVDSVCDIYHSGYLSRVDSVVAYRHHTTEIINHFRDVTKMPRLTLDVGAASFYHERQVCPFAVGELRYNAPRSTWTAFGAIDAQGRWGAGVSATFRINVIK